MVTHVWLQNKLPLVTFEIRANFYYHELIFANFKILYGF